MRSLVIGSRQSPAFAGGGRGKGRSFRKTLKGTETEKVLRFLKQSWRCLNPGDANRRTQETKANEQLNRMVV